MATPDQPITTRKPPETRGLTLRVQKELFDRLETYAIAEGRSVNGAANYLLDVALRVESSALLRHRVRKLVPPTP
jgi:hypothetical protein